MGGFSRCIRDGLFVDELKLKEYLFPVGVRVTDGKELFVSPACHTVTYYKGECHSLCVQSLDHRCFQEINCTHSGKNASAA